MGTIIVSKKRGMFVRDFNADSLFEKYVDIKYGMRGKLGKLLKPTFTKRVKIPKGNRITKIENNKPAVGSVKISFKKK